MISAVPEDFYDHIMGTDDVQTKTKALMECRSLVVEMRVAMRYADRYGFVSRFSVC